MMVPISQDALHKSYKIAASKIPAPFASLQHHEFSSNPSNVLKLFRNRFRQTHLQRTGAFAL
ncbi:hypothetical protein NIES30_15755 [Phormidium tenue NIES-30]|uniref:Uncharacterized protein n=1 Tax=Phormidium tenue NIES-30 TaxID=549789 RepID=A0A1U7J327_9CYAN|nr:hypothetical protein NIES30_15755 [Phormidium tenue NIES-30]